MYIRTFCLWNFYHFSQHKYETLYESQARRDMEKPSGNRGKLTEQHLRLSIRPKAPQSLYNLAEISSKQTAHSAEHILTANNNDHVKY